MNTVAMYKKLHVKMQINKESIEFTHIFSVINYCFKSNKFPNIHYLCVNIWWSWSEDRSNTLNFSDINFFFPFKSDGVSKLYGSIENGRSDKDEENSLEIQEGPEEEEKEEDREVKEALGLTNTGDLSYYEEEKGIFDEEDEADEEEWEEWEDDNDENEDEDEEEYFVTRLINPSLDIDDFDGDYIGIKNISLH